MNRVPVKTELLRWARERAGRDLASLLKPFPRLEAWERGEVQPTLKQLERFARATYTPIGRAQFWREYEGELERLRALPKGGGGDFYLTQPVRVSKRFARALFTSTFGGRTSFTEAFRMLGLKKMATFRELGHRLGVGF